MPLRYWLWILLTAGHFPGGGLPAAAQAPEGGWPPTPPRLESETLPSGVRVIYLPEDGVWGVGGREQRESQVEIAFGFALTSGAGNRSGALDEAARAWLFASVPARTIHLIAHLTGGEFEVVQSPDLAAGRVRVSEAFVQPVLRQVASFLGQEPSGAILDYALGTRQPAPGDPPRPMEEAARVVRDALLELSTTGAAVPPPTPDLVREYFREHFETRNAWIILSRPLTPSDLRSLGGIRRHGSGPEFRPEPVYRELTPMDMRLMSRPEGGVVVGSRIAGVYYEGWFNTLVVDQALGRLLPQAARSSLLPSRVPGVHTVSVPVRYPDYPEDAHAAILDGIRRLQFGLPDAAALPAIKNGALARLARRPVLEWFAAQDLWGPLEEGWARLWNLTLDEFVSSATAFAREPRFTVTWAPALDTPAVAVGRLGLDSPPEAEEDGPARVAPGRITIPSLQELPVVERDPVTIERLDSNVSVAVGPPAVFVSGAFGPDLPGGDARRGPNGVFWTFPELPGPEVLEDLRGVRPDRLLFFSPEEERSRVRRDLEGWNGSDTDATATPALGAVATIDLPALVILRTWLERRLIEAGWSDQVEIAIHATDGSSLSVRADPVRERAVREWLESARQVFGTDAGEREFLQLRTAAGAAFDRLRTDLQVLLWQRAPDGMVLAPESVSLEAFLNMLEAYY